MFLDPVILNKGKSGQGSKRNDLKNIVASRSMMSDTSLLIICMLAASPLVAIETEWPGLGVSECRNRSTCHVGEFCSLKSDIFGDCRNCTLLIQWCYQDFDYLRRNYPSCEATCEREFSKNNTLYLHGNISALIEERNAMQDKLDYMEAAVQAADEQLQHNRKELNATQKNLTDAMVELQEQKSHYEFIFTVAIICVTAFIVLLLLVLMCLSCWVWSVQRENKQLKEHSRREVSMICTAKPVDLQKWSSCPFFKLYRFKSVKPTLPAQVSLACPEGQELFDLAERGDHCTFTEIPLDTDNDTDTRDGEENDAADGNSVAGPAQCTDSGHASESSSLSGEHQVAPNGPRTTFTLGDELDFMQSNRR